MDYIIGISVFDPDHGNYRTERKTVRASGLYEAVKLAEQWKEQNTFAEAVSVYLPSGGAFECLRSTPRRGTWEIVKRVKR